jgi:uncharacterized membrane protein
MQLTAGKSKPTLSRFLVTRGVWLILLEATVVSLGFDFGLDLLFQVIWAIGASFILLAALVWLPRLAVGALGLAIMLGHGALTPHEAPLAILKPLWSMALWPGSMSPLPGYVSYPVVPWLGVMCLGFAIGPIFRFEPVKRRTWLTALGLAAVGLGVFARVTPAFGDPAPVVATTDPWIQALSFLNVEKYPPSAAFLLWMSGGALLLLPLLEALRGPVASVFLAFGRVPLFTYVLHLFVAHGLALLVGLALGVPAGDFLDMRQDPARAAADGWGFGVAGVYVAWAATLVLIYPPAHWFSDYKRRHRDWWLSYL